MIKGLVSIESQYLSNIFKLMCFLNLLSSVNSKPLKWKPVGIPGFVLLFSEKGIGSLLPPIVVFPPVHPYLGLTYIGQLYVALWHLFDCFHILGFGFPYVVDLSHRVPRIGDLSHQRDCYFTGGTSSALGHCVLWMEWI